MSQKDIEICRSFDLTCLADQPNYDHMRELHDALVATYAADDASEAAYANVDRPLRKMLPGWNNFAARYTLL